MKRQSGFTTFTVTLLLILILIGISLLVGKLMVADRKVSVNEVQYRQALALAEVGIADGMGRLAADTTWRTGNSGATTTLSTGSYTLTALDTTPITVGAISLTPVALSASAALADGMGGSATVRVQVAGYSLMSDAKTVPLMVAGGTSIGGSFNVVANPNGGGPGVPISVWSDKSVAGTGSWQTCHQGDFNGSSCGGTISDKNHIGADIKQNDVAGFPKDLLYFLFGEHQDPAGWANMVAMATGVSPSLSIPGGTTFRCSDLKAASSGIYIFDGNDGDCDLSDVVGSTSAPVVLIVKNAEKTKLSLNGNLNFNGLIYAYSSDTTQSPEVKANGTATVNGSLIANAPFKITSGTFNVKYDQNVVSSIQSGANFQASKVLPGSWRDW